MKDDNDVHLKYVNLWFFSQCIFTLFTRSHTEYFNILDKGFFNGKIGNNKNIYVVEEIR